MGIWGVELSTDHDLVVCTLLLENQQGLHTQAGLRGSTK